MWELSGTFRFKPEKSTKGEIVGLRNTIPLSSQRMEVSLLLNPKVSRGRGGAAGPAWTGKETKFVFSASLAFLTETLDCQLLLVSQTVVLTHLPLLGRWSAPWLPSLATGPLPPPYPHSTWQLQAGKISDGWGKGFYAVGMWKVFPGGRSRVLREVKWKGGRGEAGVLEAGPHVSPWNTHWASLLSWPSHSCVPPGP